MIFFRVVWNILDFFASILGWGIIMILLITTLNGASITTTKSNGETHCFGKCETTKSEVTK